jgi:hypothetical protein
MSVMQIMPGLLALMAGGGGGGGSAADFTIEWWQKVENNSNNARPWSVGLYSTQILSLSYEEGMTSDYFWINSGFRGIAAQNHVGAGWRHMAYVRANGVVKGYVNGVQYTGDYPADQLITDTTTPLYVGTGEIAAGTYKGYITNLHIMKGVAKYLTNFTPPVLPTTAGLGSVMLLPAQDDGSKYTDTVGAKVATLTGTVSWSADTPFTPTGPFTQFSNSWGSNSGNYNIDFGGDNYNGNLLNAVIGWTVSDGNGFRGTVTADAFLVTPSVIRIGVDFDPAGSNTWTFTQPALGGSLYFEGSSYLNYGASVDWAMDVTTPTYGITPTFNNVDEGSSVTFTVSGLDVPNGTYYWTVSNSGDFVTSSGSFSMTSNSGSFSVTPAADVTSEGSETFSASVRTGSTSGTIVATSSSVTINDTSLAPVPPFSLQFVQSETDYLDVAASSDWSMGTTWTIEWWNKSAKASSGGDLLTVMCQNFNTSGIQILYQNGFQIQGGATIAPEPVPGVWTHVALVSDGTNLKLYYNGVRVYTGGAWNLNNTTDPVRIGARGTATFQRFDGQLAMIRISNAVKYSTTFTPSITYGVEADTKLFLGSDTPLVDSSVSARTITNNGVTISTNFPSTVGSQSLLFNQPEGDFLSTPASADWNLGNNWTMEFWMNANNSSNAGINIPGGQWGLINQGGWYGGMPDDNCILVGLAAGNLTINQSANGDIQFVEPAPNVWTHVAVVNNGGGSEQKVYYNGVEQSLIANNYQTNGKTNTTADLYIGRLSNQYAGYASHFDGKMAMIRISNAAKYLTTFTPTTTYGVEADTKLFLGSSVPWADTSVSAHFITNNGAGISTSFPA